MVYLTIAIAAGTACFCGAAIFFWRNRRGGRTIRHIVSLAVDIAEVAGSVEADLAGVAGDAAFTNFPLRCRDYAQRARHALQEGKALRQREPDSLSIILLELHDDHRRIVDLRSELDRALARKADGGDSDRNRIIRYGRTSPSRWATSSLLNRPSTFT
jgi:hypothetical protein